MSIPIAAYPTDRDPLITTETDKNKYTKNYSRPHRRFLADSAQYGDCILLPNPGFKKHKISCLVWPPTASHRLPGYYPRHYVPGDPMASRAVNMCIRRSSLICLSHEISSHCPVSQGSFSHVGRGMLPLRMLHELHELHANTNT